MDREYLPHFGINDITERDIEKIKQYVEMYLKRKTTTMPGLLRYLQKKLFTFALDNVEYVLKMYVFPSITEELSIETLKKFFNIETPIKSRATTTKGPRKPRAKETKPRKPRAKETKPRAKKIKIEVKREDK